MERTDSYHGEAMQAAEPKDPAKGKRNSRRTYLALRWCLEIFCCVFVVLAVVWGTVQLLGLIDFLGVSREPPGLKYEIENPT